MVTKSEVEGVIKDKDDFIKINYLMRFLKEADNLELKKFIHLKLASINESRNMLSESIKHINSAAEISITFRDKIDLYMKASELYIKIRDFEMAEKSFKKAYAIGNTYERTEIQTKYKEVYKMQANFAEQQGKTRIAIEIYEKLISITQNESQLLEIKEKLLELYEKMGRIKDYNNLKKRIDEQKNQPREC